MWLVKIELTMVPDQESESPSSLLDDTYAELLKIARSCDPNMLAVLADNEATFSMIVDDEDRLTAFRNATSTLRTALHAAGAHTPKWEQQVEDALARSRMSSEPVAA